MDDDKNKHKKHQKRGKTKKEEENKRSAVVAAAAAAVIADFFINTFGALRGASFLVSLFFYSPLTSLCINVANVFYYLPTKEKKVVSLSLCLSLSCPSLSS